MRRSLISLTEHKVPLFNPTRLICGDSGSRSSFMRTNIYVTYKSRVNSGNALSVIARFLLVSGDNGTINSVNMNAGRKARKP